MVGDLAGFVAGVALRGHALRPGTDHAPRPGRLLGRRQDRHQHQARQEPRRRVPSAEVRARRHRRARFALPLRDLQLGLCRGGQIRPDRRRRLLSPGSKRTGARSPAGEPEREHAIAVSCRAKAAIVAADETEQGQRALLNFGHTFAHASRPPTGFSDRLMHGEAVAIGMVTRPQFSTRLGACADRGRSNARRGPPEAKSGCRHGSTTFPAIALDGETLMRHMAQDKKVSTRQAAPSF